MAGQEELGRELAALAARVSQLEREIAGLRRSPIAYDPAALVRPAGPVPEQPSAPPSRAGVTSAAPDKEGKAALPLETRIGSQVLNRVGIFAVLAGAAWFLKLAIDRGWIGPWPRVLVGLLAAAALTFFAARFRNRGFAAFGQTLQAIATGLAYLSVWTAFSVYHLVPGAVAFTAMLAATGANSWLAWRQDSSLLAAYALAGGLATPALLWTGGDHEILLFSYLLLLDAAVVALAALRPWERLVVAAFAGSVVYYAVWWFAQFTAADAPATAVFLVLFFGFFALTPGWLLGRPRRSGLPGKTGRAVLAWLPIANGALVFLAADGLLAAMGQGGQRGWISFSIALCFGGLLRLPSAGERARLWRVHAAVAFAFLTLAVPLGFHHNLHGSMVVLLWAAEAWALAQVTRRRPEPVLRGCAFALLVLTTAAASALAWVSPLAQPIAVAWNPHFLSAAAACATFAGIAAQTGRREPGGRLLSATAILGLNVITLVAISIEIHHYWACGARVGADLCGAAAGASAETAARFTYSAFYMLHSAVLVALGFWLRSAFLRWQALAILTISVGKVFLFDASSLSSVYRVLSFLGLGMLLLIVSFAYQKRWLAAKLKHLD